jgi:hypothetical protein
MRLTILILGTVVYLVALLALGDPPWRFDRDPVVVDFYSLELRLQWMENKALQQKRRVVWTGGYVAFVALLFGSVVLRPEDKKSPPREQRRES